MKPRTRDVGTAIPSHTDWPAVIEVDGNRYEVSGRFVDVLRRWVKRRDFWRLDEGDAAGLEFTWGGNRFRSRVHHIDETEGEGRAA